MAQTLLVLEDEDLLRNELERHFSAHGWAVVTAASLAEARRELFERKVEPLVVVSDMSLPDGSSLDLLEELRGVSQGGEWIVLTGYGTIPESVRALRLGAYDFLEKPCPLDRLDLVVAGAARSAQAQLRLLDHAHDEARRYAFDAFVGSSPQASEAREMLRKLAGVEFRSVVLAGETGTGKGLAARILHHGSERAGQSMVEVNCAALPEQLLESELFGHEAGSFTGATGRRRGLMEQADGGTLFLDEIGEMSLGLQVKLLKALEDQRLRRLGGEREIEVDVRIIAASNRDLEKAARDGEFRADLYHRLSVFSVVLPPLRSRIGDLDELVPRFVAEFNAVARKRVERIPERVWARLRAYSWPGNIRELRNVVERCVLLSEGPEFPEQWLQLPGDPTAPALPASSGAGEGAGVLLPLDGSVSLEDLERIAIERALESSDRNISAAARMLGVTRQTLRYRMQKYGLDAQV